MPADQLSPPRHTSTEFRHPLPPLRHYRSLSTADGHAVDPLDFERVLCNLSVKFINVTATEIDREILAGLEQVREMFRIDRFGLIELSPDKSTGTVTHACYGEGVGRVPEKVDIDQLFPWAKQKLLRGEIMQFSSLREVPRDAAVDRQSFEAMGIKANFTIPIHVAGSVDYLVVASHVRTVDKEETALFPRLRLLGEILVNALVRCQAEARHHADCAEIERLQEKLRGETVSLGSYWQHSRFHEEIIGTSIPLGRVLHLVEQVAPTDSMVLLCGETGTGKELVAQAIHKLSPRGSRFMVKVNCASLPATLVESELFGREKGAFTGALTRQAGRFEVADGSTIFLDEIAEMSLELQAKLLRVLQEGEFERLGSSKPIRVNVRVIAATNRNLLDEVKNGKFREDLYYRLNVFPIVIPPLRERIEDIPLLTWAFVNEFVGKMGKKINKINKADMAALQSYSWPGNVRELRNIIEHAVIVSTGDRLCVRLPSTGADPAATSLRMEDVERMHIQEVLRRTNWRIKGDAGAARTLGMKPSTLYSRMQKLGIAHR